MNALQVTPLQATFSNKAGLKTNMQKNAVRFGFFEDCPFCPKPNIPLPPLETIITPVANPDFFTNLVTTVGSGLTDIASSTAAPLVVIGAGAASITYGLYKGISKLIKFISLRRKRAAQNPSKIA